MAGRGRGQRLRGRSGESEALRALLASARSGSGQALVLRGEAGVGKTALLEQLAEGAAGFHIARVGGVESDMELAFAGLQQLCAPLLGQLDSLPEPQREALNVAFGRGAGPTPDRFLVGLAVLSLMAAAAEDQPLLCIVDDAQWLDEVSVQTLAFVARRLLAEPVAIVCAARDEGAEALAGLPALAVGGLSDSDARELLDSVMVGRIDPRVRDRVVAETRGNPLALLEMPRNNPASELGGGYFAVGAGRSAGQIEEGFIRRIEALPPDTRRLLLLAAAEPVGDAAVFLGAANQLGIPIGALGPAEAEELIEFAGRIRFRHPLVRSAVYRAADLSERRAVHQALADATDPALDPDRRAWHAATAATGPDDAVAAELEASADRAQSRGGIAAAAKFLERAAALTADPAHRSARALAAARAKRDAAAPAAAHELLSIAEVGPLTDLQQAQVTRLRAQMEFVRARGGDTRAKRLADTAPALLDAAKQLMGVDDFSSRESYLEAIAAIIFAGRLGDPGALTDAAAAARTAIGDAEDFPRAVDYLLRGWAIRITDGVRAGSPALRAGLDHMRAQARSNDVHVLRWLVPAFPVLQESAALELWDEALLDELSTAAVRRAREAGALAGLPQTLGYRAGFHLLTGEFNTAATLIEEAQSIIRSTGYYSPITHQSMLLAASRGVAADAVEMFEATTAEAGARGEGRLLGVVGHAAAVLYNGLGRYEEAYVAVSDAAAREDLGIHGWALFELVEAAVHTGERAAAVRALAALQERTLAAGTDWGLGVLASTRALLHDSADEHTVDALHTEAVERLTRTKVVVHVARAQLRYGEWLRRINRRIDARRQLNAAHDLFSRMGAQAFAERSRRELLATGEKVRKQPMASGDRLTAQEAQIAKLAGEGLTNQEIGAQLFISTHTVEWHLRKVFVKLGVTSRRQLRTVSWAV
ncbi:AAA family ATPase [Mycobacterium sp. CPCC 205372]|uniref:AAA family ATPase n=1 Tax=Mycobacterium hippophais TaxID=3016340 RepID=A0ABT4Q0S9_9MYCO|nr:LuxR family transcriptional regulator [Mycobacterium hippophais]MCZ8382299.1 AAA family ATPase [Mycobacterium hippophais]